MLFRLSAAQTPDKERYPVFDLLLSVNIVISWVLFVVIDIYPQALFPPQLIEPVHFLLLLTARTDSFLHYLAHYLHPVTLALWSLLVDTVQMTDEPSSEVTHQILLLMRTL